jgi:hypothetical protein
MNGPIEMVIRHHFLEASLMAETAKIEIAAPHAVPGQSRRHSRALEYA